MNTKIAQSYVALGFSLLPVHPARHPDATKQKKPVTSLLPSGQWAFYMHNRPSATDLSVWFGNNGSDCALIGGAVSGGLAVVDIDTKADLSGRLLEDFEESVLLENEDLYKKLVRQKTVSGGQHWLFRTAQKIGNVGLAFRSGVSGRPGEINEITGNPKKIKLIETKGEGGYFLVCPSQGYSFLSGDLSTIPTLTGEEVETIFSIARSFDQVPQEHKTYIPSQGSPATANDLTPWDDYNRRATIADVLQCLQGAGWTPFPTEGSYRLRRPGATSGTHASLNQISALPNFFHCFTESAAPFEGGKTYSPFAVLALCQYGGDFSKAARELRAQGYGKKAESKGTTPPPTETAPVDFEDRVFIPTWDNRPPDVEPLVELSNVRILTRGNLALLTACAGAGKSSVLEAACSSVLAPMNDTLGLTVNAKSLLYIDSERSRADHHDSWVRMCRRAGIGEGAAVPAVVRWENIKALESLETRLQYLWSRLDTTDAPELVLIDGIGDFVADPNDSEEVTGLIYRLSAVADVRGIGVMGSLHNNPATNSDKARGVLGSELWRKAESVLMIEKVPGDDVRRLTTDYALGKNRGGSDAISSYFKWDVERKMHVSCAAPAEAQGKTVCDRVKILELVGTRPAWSYNEMKAAIMELLGKSEGTAKNRIRDLITLGKIVKSDGGTYSLAEQDRPEIPEYIHN